MDSVAISIEVTPDASSRRLLGINEWRGRLRVALTSPPHRGEANKELIRLFSDLLSVPTEDITITSGHRERRKRVRVDGIDVGLVISLLSEEMGG